MKPLGPFAGGYGRVAKEVEGTNSVHVDFFDHRQFIGSRSHMYAVGEREYAERLALWVLTGEK